MFKMGMMLIGILSQVSLAVGAEWGTFTCGTMEELQSAKWQKSSIEISNVSVTDTAEYPYLGEESHVYVSFAAVNRGPDFAFAMLSLIGFETDDPASPSPLFAVQASTLNGISGNMTDSGFGFTYTAPNALRNAAWLCWEFAATELP